MVQFEWKRIGFNQASTSPLECRLPFPSKVGDAKLANPPTGSRKGAEQISTPNFMQIAFFEYRDGIIREEQMVHPCKKRRSSIVLWRLRDSGACGYGSQWARTLVRTTAAEVAVSVDRRSGRNPEQARTQTGQRLCPNLPITNSPADTLWTHAAAPRRRICDRALGLRSLVGWSYDPGTSSDDYGFLAHT